MHAPHNNVFVVTLHYVFGVCATPPLPALAGIQAEGTADDEIGRFHGQLC